MLCLFVCNFILNVMVIINGVMSYLIDEYFLWYYYELRIENVLMSNEIFYIFLFYVKKLKVLNFFIVSVWFEVI